jgi:alpha-ketoglutarate-dependent taurine dioxygenase
MHNRISVTPLTSTIGARVDGIDLREDMNEEVSEQLRQALWDHHVLVVPNQQVGLDGQNRLTTQVADPLPAYVGNPARAFEKMLDPANGLAVGDPARIAAAIIDSVDQNPAPLRMVLGSQALDSTVATLQKRIVDFEAQTDLAASTDYPANK